MGLRTRLAAEAIGSLLLTATVIGSGIMAERLAGGNVAVALLANTAATVAVLAALIALLGPVSGAHFNPTVSLIQALRKALPWREAGAYSLVQVLGCVSGAFLAHAMFELSLLQSSLHIRTGPAQWLAEAVATFGLLLVVLGHRRAEDAPWMVAAWIGAAYWFTASTSFANPAITIARSLSDTFAGIRPLDVPAFIAAQMAGAVLALLCARVLFTRSLPMTDSVAVTIYHNPACGTSRNTLALIRNAGVEPTIIEYLQTPPDRETLRDLLKRMSMRPRELLREKGTPYAELDLGAAHWTDEQLIDQMLAHPILINRPIVVTPWGVKLCRPSEEVLEILPLPQRGPFRKEDGELVLGPNGQRVQPG
jgi:arsenate reductase (glutaredoxin)